MDLVPGVERHPAAVDVEPAGADDVAADFLEDDLAVDDLSVAFDGGAAAIAVTVRPLALRPFAHDVRDPLAHRGIAPLSVHQPAGGQVIAAPMVGTAARFPTPLVRRPVW